MMNRLTILYILTLFINYYSAQSHQNLIKNGSFELDEEGVILNMSNCVNPFNEADPGFCPTPNGIGEYQVFINYWNEVYGWMPPQRRTGCFIGPGSADVLCSEPRSGLLRFHSTGREYACQELKAPLKAGKNYYLEVYYKTSNEYLDRGLLFSLERPKQCDYNKLNIHDDPHISLQKNTDGIYVKETLFFEPEEDFSWVTIGNFTDKKTDASTISIDDLRIFELGDDYCADGVWKLQNTDLSTWIYTSQDRIEAGSHVVTYDEMYDGPVTVKSNNAVWFKAANSIILEPGFSTEPGAFFEVIITPTPCEPFDPCHHHTFAGEVYHACATQPFQIGPENPEEYMEYLWSPSTYLDDPTSPNPTFTPPPGQTGSLTYTLTLTPLCGVFYQNFGNINIGQPFLNVDYTILLNPAPSANSNLQIISTDFINCNAELEMDYDSQTEFITVSVVDLQNNFSFTNPPFSMENNTCCTFNWNSSYLGENFWQWYNPCKDYKIKIESSTHCFPNVINQKEIIWDNDENYELLTPLANVITPNGDGINDWFKLNATGVSSYNFFVYNRWGRLLYQSQNQEICELSHSGKIWAGQCNQPYCNHNCVRATSNGVNYYYVLMVFPCNGSMISYSGHITVIANGQNYCENLSQRISQAYINSENEIELNRQAENLIQEMLSQENVEHEPEFNVLLFPNPNSGKFTIDLEDVTPENIEHLFIIDGLGKIVYTHSNDLNFPQTLDLNLSRGLYLLVYKTEFTSNQIQFVVE